MISLLLGAAALVILLILLRGFIGVDPKLLSKALRYAAAIGLALAALFFAFLDRVGVAVLLGSMAYGLFTGGRAWPGGWPGWHFPYSGGGPRSQSGQTSTVQTEWIEMELDHDTGEMHARVLKGSFSGKALDTLSDEQALAFYAEAGSVDPETARLMEAYLDRRLGADWRSKARERNADEDKSTRSRRDSGMSRDEAYRVLGLEAGATEEEIRVAHRKLMLNLHPDRGGSDYLAAKINEAKDVLIGT
jgi:uncharacterized protein YjiS (DUF1127 family)